ncbi:hypothetical protein N7516_005239, partial [Penicillium verrucosum]|uniref:uncharacterized protein n=1 Tax=Penicillium verrucosum TaxID=60171 RepID=UPI0025458ABB
ELLAICGISNYSDNPIKQHILSISNFIRQIRQQVGITDLLLLPTPKASPDPKVKRGSYRFLPTAKKRSRADYTGLDVLSYKKKRKNKVKAKDKTTLKEISIIENILVNCIKLNDPLRRYGHRSKKAIMTTKSFVDNIVKLQYPDVIKQENVFSISKGAELLDPKDLPTSKGPLDEFTMAEKVATERFIREMGYGLSLAD